MDYYGIPLGGEVIGGDERIADLKRELAEKEAVREMRPKMFMPEARVKMGQEVLKKAKQSLETLLRIAGDYTCIISEAY